MPFFDMSGSTLSAHINAYGAQCTSAAAYLHEGKHGIHTSDTAPVFSGFLALTYRCYLDVLGTKSAFQPNGSKSGTKRKFRSYRG